MHELASAGDGALAPAARDRAAARSRGAVDVALARGGAVDVGARARGHRAGQARRAGARAGRTEEDAGARVARAALAGGRACRCVERGVRVDRCVAAVGPGRSAVFLGGSPVGWCSRVGLSASVLMALPGFGRRRAVIASASAAAVVGAGAVVERRVDAWRLTAAGCTQPAGGGCTQEENGDGGGARRRGRSSAHYPFSLRPSCAARRHVCGWTCPSSGPSLGMRFLPLLLFLVPPSLPRAAPAPR